MKKLLPLLLLTVIPAAYADLNHSIMSTVKLEAVSAATSADKVGSSYSVSGSGVATVDSDGNSTIGGLGTVTSGVPALTTVTASQSTSGDAFSFSQSYLEGDVTPTSAVPTEADSVEVIFEKFGISPTVLAAEGVASPSK